MIKTINRTKEFEKKMRGQGLVVTFNRPEDYKVMTEMNKRLEEFRRDFKIKEAKSWASAGKIIVRKQNNKKKKGEHHD